MSRNLGYFTFQKVQNDEFYSTARAYNLILEGRKILPYNKLKKSTNFVVTRDNSYNRVIALRSYFRNQLVQNRLGQQPKYRANGNRTPKKFNINKDRNFSTINIALDVD